MPIGFLTGTQAPINSFLDKIYLGWFVRLIFDPKTYLIRTLKSFNLISYFLVTYFFRIVNFTN